MDTLDSDYFQPPELSSRSTTLESTDDLYTPDEDLVSLLDGKISRSQSPNTGTGTGIDKQDLAFPHHVDTLTALEARRLAGIAETISRTRASLDDMQEDEHDNNQLNLDISEDGLSSRDTFDSLLHAISHKERLPNRASLYTLSNAPLLDQHHPQAGSELRYFDSVRSSLDGLLASPSQSIQDTPDIKVVDPSDDTLFDQDCEEEEAEDDDHTLFSIFMSQWHHFTIRTAFYLTVKMALFVPWCGLVGAYIVMSPKSLDKCAFWYTGIPSNGIKRYAHWADVAAEHVIIFLGFVLGFCMLFGPTVSAVLVSTLVMATYGGWKDFDWKLGQDVLLGKDDRVSVWMVLSGFDLAKAKLELEDGQVYVRAVGTMVLDEEDE